ncbi:MAG: succinyldiaminopimelate transaminase [Planctomycetota bacterium]|nr:MAG: succinyldiaminopimelate transaminase [Planctomycetota bacterium]
MNSALRALMPYPMVELNRRKQELRDQGQQLFDFGTGDPVEPTPAFIREAACAAIPEISQYPTVAGTATLRSAVADYMQRRFALSLDPQQHILPSAGSKEAIFHAALAFVDVEAGRDCVIYPTPGYPVYEAGTLFAGGRPYPVTLQAENGFRLELSQLPQDILQRCAIAWINYPHNPTGAGVDLDYLRRQWRVAKAHGFILCSDECYADLWFDEHTPAHPSLLQVAWENSLVFHSCSKRSGMTGYRSGFIAGDPHLISTYRRWRASMGVGSPTFIEQAATVAWADDDHVAARRKVFTQKYQLMQHGLANKGISCIQSYGGLYCWARVPHGLDAATYAQRCLDRGIIISPGDFFGPGGEGFFRIALVPSLDDCQRALDVWPE